MKKALSLFVSLCIMCSFVVSASAANTEVVQPKEDNNITRAIFDNPSKPGAGKKSMGTSIGRTIDGKYVVWNVRANCTVTGIDQSSYQMSFDSATATLQKPVAGYSFRNETISIKESTDHRASVTFGYTVYKNELRIGTTSFTLYAKMDVKGVITFSSLQ